jgi:hypothetical protein
LPLGQTTFEFWIRGLSNPFFASRTMAPPTAERRTHILTLDRAPEPTGALELSSLDGDAREEAQSENATGPVADLSTAASP